MNKNTFISIGAILIGFVLSAVLSVVTDILLEKLDWMSQANFAQTSLSVIILIVLYRFIYNTIGCFLIAKLAPNNPMKHVVIIGVIGTILSVLGSIAMWDKAIPFYNIAIILIAFPSAWVGGKLFLLTRK